MLSVMTSVLAAAGALLRPGTVPPTAPPTTAPVTVAPDDGGSGVIEIDSGIGNLVREVIDNLGNNPYQTGTALVVATVAVVAMMNMKVHRLVFVPTAVGAFWFGWLGWNTFTGDDNPLFPGDVSATKIWDVAFTNGTGFLIAVGAGCVAAIFLWRKSVGTWNRLLLLAGAVLGASFVYNLVESVRVA
jgi:ammonia channel protein AmtB